MQVYQFTGNNVVRKNELATQPMAYSHGNLSIKLGCRITAHFQQNNVILLPASHCFNHSLCQLMNLIVMNQFVRGVNIRMLSLVLYLCIK